MRHDMRDLLRAEGSVDLPSMDAAATPGAPGDKARTIGELEKTGAELAELQEALYAEGTRRVLLVLQGMDTSGKGGTIEHVVGEVNPLGVHIASFKKPTKEELAHNFLWRIRKRVPPPGGIGVFDRSHYEDVLVVRVHGLADWAGRYDEINAFERELTDDGVTLVKVCLHISKDEQKERLLARLDDPQKRWKFNPGDLDERDRWGEYTAAYNDALSRCSTPQAPWYVVPADRKWYRNWAVAQLMLVTLRDLDPQFPAREDLDVEACRRRLESEDR